MAKTRVLAQKFDRTDKKQIRGRVEHTRTGAHHIYRGPGLWAERDNAAPLSPKEYPEMRELLGPDLTLDDDGFIALKETP